MELRYVQSEKESIMKCPNCGKEMRDVVLCQDLVQVKMRNFSPF